MWLRRHGVAAAVVGHHIQHLIPFPTVTPFATGLDLLLLIPAQRAEAERLLAEMAEHPPEPGWERAALPDLASLDPERYAVDCPDCDASLPLDDPALDHCPTCGRAIDLLERIVEVHGPEALVECYADPDGEDPPVAFDPALLEIPCPGCRESLAGLPQTGRCPHCGQLFDKADLYGRYFR